VTCALAGIAAVDPGDLVRGALATQHLDGDITLVAVGKAAGPMAAAAIAALAGTVRQGVVISPELVKLSSARIAGFVGGHPVPNQRGADGAREIARLVRGLRPGETLLCLLSGGASSLMTLPPDGISVADVAAIASALMRAGATIQELNCVRKHLDQLKGGRLAVLASPARVVALVLSDVVGDSLDTIASGPTVADPTTVANAVAVLQRHGVWEQAPPSVRAHLERADDESPKPGDPGLARAVNRIIGSNATAATAARDQARNMGYLATVVTTSLIGEANEIGADIVRQTREECNRTGKRVALIFAGETTVTVKGSGAGGRNQELALGAAIAMDGISGMAVASLGTDGIDGPTDAAGAVADGESAARARALGLDPRATLVANDSHTFWKALGALIRTGPTGTNVMDIVVSLAVPQKTTA
jgi:hydroxypyruvate reductase